MSGQSDPMGQSGLAGQSDPTGQSGRGVPGAAAAGSPTSRAIARANAEGRAALISYLPYGFPDHAGSVDAVKALIDAGVDVVELGIPYSDPVMDGPVIEDASIRALAAGATVDGLFRAVEALAPLGVPILPMTYYNLVFHRGVEKFAADLAQAGGAGLVTPDLIPDEAGEWLEASDAHGLDRVFLVAPTTTNERLALTVGACRGFTYVTSTMGVTGERTSLSGRAKALARRAEAAGADHACVGIGISRPEHAAEVAQFADGVIVGSAFVRRLADAPNPAAARTALAELAGALRAAAVRG